MKKAKDTITGRQKPIKLTDQSDHGWATVAEYETNELAADEDDEKRIQRAEARAAKKIKKKQHTDQASNSRNISLEVEWIPRTENERADYICRILDADDWAVSDIIFNQCEQMWGPRIIDRFATYFNTKLPRFHSRLWNPGCKNIDAFTVGTCNQI